LEQLNVGHNVLNEDAMDLSLASLHNLDDGCVDLEPTLRFHLPFDLDFFFSCFNGLLFDWWHGDEVQPELLALKCIVHFDALIIVIKSAFFGFLFQQDLHLRVAKL
jgi:hypothetical protein